MYFQKHYDSFIFTDDFLEETADFSLVTQKHRSGHVKPSMDISLNIKQVWSRFSAAISVKTFSLCKSHFIHVS
jgi:hypothetical protein